MNKNSMNRNKALTLEDAPEVAALAGPNVSQVRSPDLEAALKEADEAQEAAIHEVKEIDLPRVPFLEDDGPPESTRARIVETKEGD